VEDKNGYRGVEVAQPGIVIFYVKREPRMLSELRVGSMPTDQIERGSAVGIEPCRDNGSLRGSHIVRGIVKQDAVLRLRQVEEEDKQRYDQSTEEA
jgi:hypothetical protein